jgi:hypothetical protein
MKRTVREIVEEIEGLEMAWPTAPPEVRAELLEALEALKTRPEVAPRPTETRRGRTPTRYRRSTCR